MINMPDLKEKPNLSVIKHLEVVVIDCLDLSTMLYREAITNNDTNMRVMADDFASIAQQVMEFCLDWGYGVCTDESNDSINNAATNLRCEVHTHNYPEFAELHEVIEFRIDTMYRNYDF